jgi:hypothetical protein
MRLLFIVVISSSLKEGLGVLDGSSKVHAVDTHDENDDDFELKSGAEYEPGNAKIVKEGTATDEKQKFTSSLKEGSGVFRNESGEKNDALKGHPHVQGVLENDRGSPMDDDDDHHKLRVNANVIEEKKKAPVKGESVFSRLGAAIRRSVG